MEGSKEASKEASKEGSKEASKCPMPCALPLMPFLQSLPFAAAIFGPNLSCAEPVWCNAAFGSAGKDCLAVDSEDWVRFAFGDRWVCLMRLRPLSQPSLSSPSQSSLPSLPYPSQPSQPSQPSTSAITDTASNTNANIASTGSTNTASDSNARTANTSNANTASKTNTRTNTNNATTTTTTASLLLSTDWSKTSLGPPHLWPASLSTSLSIVMTVPHPAALWWGPDLVCLYNDSYRNVAGKNHPRMFGAPGRETWGDLWAGYARPLSEAAMRGQVVAVSEDLLVMERHGFREEMYHDWSWAPVRDESNVIRGLYNTDIEITNQVISKRRLQTLHSIAEHTSRARSRSDFPRQLFDALRMNDKDVPFAMYYQCGTAAGPDFGTQDWIDARGEPSRSDDADSEFFFDQDISLELCATLGISRGHHFAPSTVNLAKGSWKIAKGFMSRRQSHDEGLTSEEQYRLDSDQVWPFRRACLSRKPIVMEEMPELQEYGLKSRSNLLSEPPRSAVMLSISGNDASHLPEGILILGLNPMRPYDEECENWLSVLNVQLSNSMAGIHFVENFLKQTERLSELDRAKSCFFSNLSHELRTPLTLISAPLDDITEDLNMDFKVRNKLRLAQRNVHRLTRLVSGLLEFSTSEAHKFIPNWQLLNLGLFTEELANIFRPAIEDSGIKFEVECDVSDKPVVIDPGFWEKICANIISNALKFTISGTISVSMRYREGVEVILVVRDTGVGIAKREQSKVFERFYRAESSSRSNEGSGMGLALVKELVLLLSGQISVNSVCYTEDSVNSGTTFTCTIPVRPPDVDVTSLHLSVCKAVLPTDTAGNSLYSKGAVAEMKTWGSVIPDNTTGTPTSEVAYSEVQFDPNSHAFSKDDLILVVDDNVDMLNYITSILEPYCTVITAANGEDALDVAIIRKPNLIVTDLMMPKISGFQLLAALRSRPDMRLTPVIVLSACAGADAAVDGLMNGADDYIQKPFKTRELVARIYTQLRLGKQRISLEKSFSQRNAEFRAMVDSSPLGLFRMCLTESKLLYANEKYHDFTGHPENEPLHSWRDYMTLPATKESSKLMQRLKHDGKPITAELAWLNGNTLEITLLIPEGADYCIGTALNVSDRIALAQQSERRIVEAEERRVAAEESKAAQEMMIDVTSHELRNPISAVLQNAEMCKINLQSLISKFVKCRSHNKDFCPTDHVIQELREDLEALNSILSCSQASERICNDILRMAQLELGTLAMKDSVFNIVGKAKECLQIFRNEAKSKGITLYLHVDESLRALELTTISADYVRLGQILINLISNAITFLAGSKKVTRRLGLEISATVQPIPVDGSLAISHSDRRDYCVVRPGQTVFLVYTVSDTGPGIKKEELELLFKRFQQGSNAIHTLLGGSGLGLYICRQLAEKMGGRIEVESELGKGSHFRFSIQAEKVENVVESAPIRSQPATPLRPQLKTRGSSLGSDSSTKSPSSPGMVSTEFPARPSFLIEKSEQDVPPTLKKLESRLSRLGLGSNHSDVIETSTRGRILIVEDNNVNSKILSRQFKKAGFSTTVASNGQEALALISASFKTEDGDDCNPNDRFNAITLDLSMPVLNGFETAKKLRHMEQTGELPIRHNVVAVTGNAREGQRTTALEAGVDEVVIKPYKFEELLALISQLANTRR